MDHEEAAVKPVAYTSNGATVGGGSWDHLREQAVAAQRLRVCRGIHRYRGGTVKLGASEPGRVFTKEKVFSVRPLWEWDGKDVSTLVEDLRVGRVRRRVSAPMGAGKSTTLPQLLAQALDWPVLYVSLDAVAIQEMINYMVDGGKGRYGRVTSKPKGGRVYPMTYGDYCAAITGSKRGAFLNAYPLVIFDEAFVPECHVFVAKRLFAVYAPAHISLLLVSATISTDQQGESASSVSMGTFRVLEHDLDVETAIASGKLVESYLQDRTIALVPSDAEVAALVEYYTDEGVDARGLDTASFGLDVSNAGEWLHGESTTPRVLVATTNYGIAYNFACSYELFFPKKEVVVVRDNVAETIKVPLTAEMVAQGKARTGRDIVPGSGGVICSPERSVVEDLEEHDKLEAFVLLHAAFVTPCHTAFWADCWELFPKGLTPGTARQLLRMNLHPAIAAKFLASDGLVAGKYHAAVTFFSVMDAHPLPSKEPLPVGHEDWIEVSSWSGHGGGEAVELPAALKLPVRATGEIEVVLLAIAAMSAGHFDCVRWRVDVPTAVGDGYDTDEEKKVLGGGRRLRLPEVPEPPSVELVVREERRRGHVFFPGGREEDPVYASAEARVHEALRSLDALLVDFQVTAPGGVVMGPDSASVELPPAVGTVESPGGGAVCTLSADVCHTVNLGRPLRVSQLEEFVVVAKPVLGRFVNSKLFDCFGGAWDSYLDALLEPAAVERLRMVGLGVDAYKMVDMLHSRFATEVFSVLQNSNVFKRRFMRIFSRAPSFDEVMHSIQKGDFSAVAQTDGFISRVKVLKDKIDATLLYAQEHNMWLPRYITNAQAPLPLRGRNPVGVVGRELAAMPRGVADAMAQRNRLVGRFARVKRDW